ncbi:nucleoside transporter 1, putative (NT1) [Plasmodium ovale wallikeri]|uniref:Nucleoside transporter 1, putative (NT1) n=1 Tax=Plasmodium ovale wallikeri TaxID=864142 RepID=A0A1A8Z9G8_PLAOA|nr:nucleoside transporter 1, putative (NT1) [Plasmodium ovale wallikeri]
MSTGKESSKTFVDIEKKGGDYKDGKGWSGLSKRQEYILPFTFILIGLSSLNVWNTALGLNINFKYNTFQITGLVCSSIIAIFINIPKLLLPYCLGGLAMLCGGFQIAHRYFSFYYFDKYCLIAFIVIGIMAGLAQTIAFSIGTTMENNMGGYMSAGIGISGVFIFVINLLLDQVVPDKKLYNVNEAKLLYLFIICELCLVLAIFFSVFNLELSSNNDKKEEEDSSKEEGLSYMELIKDSYKAILAMFLVNWLSLQLFPGVGHKKWQESHGISDYYVTVIVGMFQVFDFISRYPPNLSHIKYFKFFTFSLNKLLIANFLRLLFIPWFVLNAAVSKPFFTNIVQQCICMALLAFTNGWFNTVPFIVFVQELKKAKKKKDIETISTFMVVAIYQEAGALVIAIFVWLVIKKGLKLCQFCLPPFRSSHRVERTEQCGQLKKDATAK